MALRLAIPTLGRHNSFRYLLKHLAVTINPWSLNSPPSLQRVLHAVVLLSRTRLVALLVMVAILVSCIAFSWTTRDAMVHLPFLGQQKQVLESHREKHRDQKSIVDQSPWLTVQSLTPLAVSSEERQYARDAARLADHEVDQAFAAALRQATMQRKTLTGEALARSQKVAQFQEIVKEDQARVQSLTAPANSSAAAKMNRDQAASGTDDLEVAKAQLALDQDELRGCAAGIRSRVGRPARQDSTGARGAQCGDQQIRRAVRRSGTDRGSLGPAIRHAGWTHRGMVRATQPI